MRKMEFHKAFFICHNFCDFCIFLNSTKRLYLDCLGNQCNYDKTLSIKGVTFTPKRYNTPHFTDFHHLALNKETKYETHTELSKFPKLSFTLDNGTLLLLFKQKLGFVPQKNIHIVAQNTEHTFINFTLYYIVHKMSFRYLCMKYFSRN